MLIIKDNKGEDGRRKEEDTIKKGVKMVLSYIGIIMVVNKIAKCRIGGRRIITSLAIRLPLSMPAAFLCTGFFTPNRRDPQKSQI